MLVLDNGNDGAQFLQLTPWMGDFLLPLMLRHVVLPLATVQPT